jgi:hypothetical protein
MSEDADESMVTPLQTLPGLLNITPEEEMALAGAFIACMQVYMH